MTALRELSLFTGAGGGVLGSHLLGWTPVGYVEWDDYCQRVLKARIQDGLLPNAPIFGDVRAFNRDGYARAYQGLVDVVTAGFPCQPFSVAGKQLGADDPRNMWPATAECLSIIRPPYALLENVPGLIAAGYLPTILGDLAELGYDVRWGVISASDAIWDNSYPGAPAFEHGRRRLWMLAYSRCLCNGEIQHQPECGSDTKADAGFSGAPADPDGQRQPQPQGPECDKRGRVMHGDNEAAANTADPDSDGVSARTSATCEWGEYFNINRREIRRGPESTGWWSTEPAVGRVAHGVANRMGQLRAIGNGQVPAVVRLAWNTLMDGR